MSRWIVLCALLGLGACTPLDEGARWAASVSTRWIGMTKPMSGGCPVPTSSDWSVRPLFPVPAHGLSRRLQASANEAGLDRFCVYEYRGRDPRPELPDEVADQLAAAEPDKAALTTSAVPALGTVTRDPFQQRFLDQVQIPATLPAARSPRVRLAFLDTQKTEEDAPRTNARRRSEHGHTLIQIAGRLASGQAWDPSRPLPIQIASRLTMPLVKLDAQGREERDEEQGGARGTFADLATALWQEIGWWDRQPEPRRLVLNLSLGWDGEKLGGWEPDADDMPPEVRAVYQVLEVAACEGILVIAAAGNERPGPGATKQPFLPAGWESSGRARREKCQAQPRAYAVSGIDGRGHPLVNTRARGEAPRVAYADHVVVPNFHDPGRPTATLTGTSVAAAVVSTTAALVWQYHPELSAAEVMELLSRSGKALPRNPDFSMPVKGAPEPVRRIALCPALQKAGVPGPFGCPLPSPLPPLKEKLSILRPDRKIQMPPLPSVSLLSKPRNVNDQVSIGPQPGENPCPNCAVIEPPDQVGAVPENPALQQATGFARASFQLLPDPKESDQERDYRLLIEIPSVWPASLLREATLEVFVFDSATGRKQRLDDGCRIHPLGAPGETLEVTRCFKKIRMGTPFQASLSFVMASEDGGPSYSIESPLFVEY